MPKKYKKTQAQLALEKAPWLWIRDEKGKKSASLTLAVVAFTICSFWIGLSIIEQIGDIKIRAFDSVAAVAYMSPCLALYWGRRKTKADDEKHERETTS